MRVVCVLVALLACASSFPAQLCAQQPDSTDAAVKEHLDRGKQALQDRKYKDALEAFKSANKLKGDSCADCYFLTSITYYRMHDVEHALDASSRAIAAADNDGLRALAHNLKGNLLLNSSGGDAKRLRQAEEEFQSAIKADPKSPIFHLNLAKALLRESRDDAAKQQLQECLACAPDPKMKAEAEKLMARPERGREDEAPDFQVTTSQGQQLSLQSLAGRIVVMDFWATWCPPCRESVPELKDLTKKYPTDKLVLISVSADKDENAWREFVAKKKMDWAQYRDSDHRVLDAFGIRAFPTYLVIDGDGYIQERITGLNPQQTVVHRLKEVLGRMPQLEGETRK